MSWISIVESADHILEPLTESVGGVKRMFLEGIHAQAEIVNGNGRKYPAQVLREAVEIYNRDFVSKNRAIGELNHPNHTMPNPERAAIWIKKLTMEGNDVYGKSEILDDDALPCGKAVRALVARGITLGVSTRGMGLLSESRGVTNVKKYRMTAIDVVANPSAPQAFVKGILEGLEDIVESLDADRAILEEAYRSRELDISDRMRALAQLMSKIRVRDR